MKFNYLKFLFLPPLGSFHETTCGLLVRVIEEEVNHEWS
jgi:hypothetical protein